MTVRERAAHAMRRELEMASHGYTLAIEREAPSVVRRRLLDRWLHASAELARLEGVGA